MFSKTIAIYTITALYCGLHWNVTNGQPVAASEGKTGKALGPELSGGGQGMSMNMGMGMGMSENNWGADLAYPYFGNPNYYPGAIAGNNGFPNHFVNNIPAQSYVGPNGYDYAPNYLQRGAFYRA